MIFKYVTLAVILSVSNVEGDLRDWDLDSFILSVSSAVERENLDELAAHFDRRYIEYSNEIISLKKIFNNFDSIEVHTELGEPKYYRDVIEVKIKVKMSGIPLGGTERIEFIKEEQLDYWIERRGDSLLIIGDMDYGKRRVLERMFDTLLGNEVSVLLTEFEKAVEEGDLKRFKRFFHSDYLHDGESCKALEASFIRALGAGGLSINFSNLSLNERSNAPDGWPKKLWVDATVSLSGPAVSSVSSGLLKSGRTTLSLRKEGDKWLIAGNGEPGTGDIDGLRSGSLSRLHTYLLILFGTMAVAGLALARKKKVYLLLSVVAVLSGGGLLWAIDKKEARPNIILITVDTLRADHVGSYGAGLVATPVMDGIARDGILFENAYCPMPHTAPSHATILTSLYPRQHGVMLNGHSLPRRFETLAEVLREEGYVTSAFVASFVLGAEFGFGSGFERFDDEMEHGLRTAGEVVHKILPWLEENAGNEFFTWIHLYDPHVPLTPPEPFKSKYPGDDYASLYKAEVAYTDSRLGLILAALKSLSVEEETIVILTADHGESLGEHDYWGHGQQLYEVSVRVPLIVKIPGKLAAKKGILPRSSRIQARVRIMDIFPTVLELLGIEERTGLQGSSFLPLMRKNHGLHRDVYMISMPPGKGVVPPYQKNAVLTGQWKLIRFRGADDEIYNLVEDPDELNDMRVSRPEVFKKLTGEIAKWEKIINKSAPHSRKQIIDEATKKRLRAFGYVY